MSWSSARRFAMARPISPAAPVTMATDLLISYSFDRFPERLDPPPYVVVSAEPNVMSVADFAKLL
ncbi:hypothetical protein RsS62_23030 [Rhizobium dioscoreae]|nr:hypothetical protein RsS62_23030 [Rhizobium dioscoreae]